MFQRWNVEITRVSVIGRALFKFGRPAGIEEFCARWKNDVYAFCRTFIGAEAAAEKLTCDVLVAGCGLATTVDHPGEIKSQLMGLALQKARKYQARERPSRGGALETVIQGLQSTERAVLIMRHVLRMDWGAIARATGLSQMQAHEAWVRGVHQFNHELHPDATREKP